MLRQKKKNLETQKTTDMEAQSQHTYGKGGISTKNQGGETLEKNNKSFYFNILMQKTKHDQKKKSLQNSSFRVL